MALIQSTARNKMILMVSATDHVTGLVGLTLTITLSKNGGTFASITPVVTDLGDGWYSLALTALDTDTIGDFALHITAPGADPTDTIDEVVIPIANSVWDELSTSHTAAGTTGLLLSQIGANTSSIMISQTTLTSLVNTVLKYERNRTKIDTTAATLTIYDDDCTTPLTVFNLKDHLGNPSVSEVCDRSPVGCP